MKTYHHNEEHWYADLTPLWHRLLRWFVWLGGWEMPTWSREGYHVRWHVRGPLGRALQARRRGERGAIFRCLCPLGFFGNTIVFQSFGFHIRTRYGYFCVGWPPHTSPGAKGWQVYWSPSATPHSATLWICGAPPEAVRAADLHANERADKEERWQAELRQKAERSRVKHDA